MPNYQIITKSTTLGDGRKASKKFARRYPNTIILLYDGYNYRAYDNCALAFCKALGIDPYENQNGEIGVEVSESDLIHFYFRQLEALSKNYILKKHSKLEIHTLQTDNVIQSNARRLQDTTLPIASDGKGVDLIENGEHFKVVLSKNVLSISTEITRSDGTKEIIQVPVEYLDNHKVLSENSGFYQALNGKHLNEKVTCNDHEYLIFDIYDFNNNPI